VHVSSPSLIGLEGAIQIAHASSLIVSSHSHQSSPLAFDAVATLKATTRATRARFPNLPGGLEVSCGYDCMISSNKAKWTPPNFNKYGPVDFYTDNQTATQRTDTPSGWFQHYMIGVDGLCSVYDPPVSYWCSEHPSGGGAFAFRTPSGVTAGPSTVLSSPCPLSRSNLSPFSN
jgi:hypothetical protein